MLRDLFRKSGRPLEKELDLVPVEPVRRHGFEDETSSTCPAAAAAPRWPPSRRLGPGLGAQWSAYVDTFADVWEALRRDYFERPCSPEHAGAQAQALLSTRLTLHKMVQRSLKDERLREVAGHAAVLEGHDLRNVPAWVGMWTYVEQNFGAWTVPGGMGSAGRGPRPAGCATRGVTVLTGTPVQRPGRVRTAGWSACAPRRATSTPTWSWSPSTRAGCPPWPATSSAPCRRSRR